MIQTALLALLLQAPAQGAPPSITAPRIEAPVVVDGVLDEAAWQQATALGPFHQYEPADGRPAEERTDVRVWYAPDAIYFGIRAYDTQPGRIRATRADRDNIDGEDHIVIYLDTFADRRRAFMFGVNALGVQMDGVRTEGAASAGRIFGGNIDTNPDFLFESAGRVTEDGYIVEVRIPFKTLRFPTSAQQNWGLQVERVTQRTGYRDTWTDVRRASASYLVQAGTIAGLHGLERGMVLEGQPFFTASSNGRVTPTGFRRERTGRDVGANLKMSFSSVALDATINPDFSQVESDAGQVTINERFALFFPEKRPFFLEGIELFNTPNQLVYTRQIVDPIAGGKVTGKLGPIAVAHLTALDEDADGVRDGSAGGHEALFNVARLRRDFGANSLVGLTATDRSLMGGPAYNRVLAADTRIVFGKLYYFEAQAGGSWTREATTPGGEIAGARKDGEIWKLEFDRTGRMFGFNYKLNGISPDFITRAGFVNRNNVISAAAFNRFTYYGDTGAAVETITTFFGPTLVWDYDDFASASPVETSGTLSTSFRFRGGWTARLGLNRDGVDLDPADYASYNTGIGPVGTQYSPLEEVVATGFSIGVATPTFQRFNADASIGHGGTPIFQEGSKGRGTKAQVSLSLRPNSVTRASIGTSYQRIYRERDDSEFAHALIPRLQAEFQPRRSLFFRAISEYRMERRAALQDARTGAPLRRGTVAVPAQETNGLRVDLLAAYEPTPGTVAYFGYGSSRADTGCGSITGCRSFSLDRLERMSDGLFIKLAYLFRR